MKAGIALCALLKTLRKALVLEPTRFLVEQTARRFVFEGFDAMGIHSGIKGADWTKRVIVTTPESALVYIQRKYGETVATSGTSDEFPIVVIDECHHTVGQDPFAKVRSLGFLQSAQEGKVCLCLRLYIRCIPWHFHGLFQQVSS